MGESRREGGEGVDCKTQDKWVLWPWGLWRWVLKAGAFYTFPAVSGPHGGPGSRQWLPWQAGQNHPERDIDTETET